MSEIGAELVRRVMEEAARNIDAATLARLRTPLEPPTIHCSELPPSREGDELFVEWNAYRREVLRLVAEGHEGRFALIRGDAVVGVWDTEQEARAAGLRDYATGSYFIHQVREREPSLLLSVATWRCRL